LTCNPFAGCASVAVAEVCISAPMRSSLIQFPLNPVPVKRIFILCLGGLIADPSEANLPGWINHYSRCCICECYITKEDVVIYPDVQVLGISIRCVMNPVLQLINIQCLALEVIKCGRQEYSIVIVLYKRTSISLVKLIVSRTMPALLISVDVLAGSVVASFWQLAANRSSRGSRVLFILFIVLVTRNRKVKVVSKCLTVYVFNFTGTIHEVCRQWQCF
jgi:hypothetical protein